MNNPTPSYDLHGGRVSVTALNDKQKQLVKDLLTLIAKHGMSYEQTKESLIIADERFYEKVITTDQHHHKGRREPLG